MSSFKETTTLAERQAESARIRAKFPDRIPVIVERAPRSSVPNLDKNKFLVPVDLTVGQFAYVIRRRLTLPPTQALFLFIANSLPATSAFMRELYSFHKDVDGFLYVRYSGESTFGGDEEEELDE